MIGTSYIWALSPTSEVSLAIFQVNLIWGLTMKLTRLEEEEDDEMHRFGWPTDGFKRGTTRRAARWTARSSGRAVAAIPLVLTGIAIFGIIYDALQRPRLDFVAVPHIVQDLLRVRV